MKKMLISALSLVCILAVASAASALPSSDMPKGSTSNGGVNGSAHPGGAESSGSDDGGAMPPGGEGATSGGR